VYSLAVALALRIDQFILKAIMGKKKGGKGKDEVKMTYLGRPSNNVKIGIVGLPNVGKSSFFNLLCKMDVPAENFPFCTIEPTVSRVPVPDRRFNRLCKDFKPKKEIPAVLTVTDIAGLVKGASEGAGLGNAFLSNIQAVDAIFHQVRTFKDKDVTHVESSIDPLRDIEIINKELLLKDIQLVQKLVDTKKKNVERGVGGKEAKMEFHALEKALDYLKTKGHVRFGTWSSLEIEVLNTLQLLTAKPQVYLINMSEKNFTQGRSNWLPKLKDLVAKLGGEPILPFSVALEKTLFDMKDDAEREAFCKKNKVRSQLPTIIKKGYHNLKLIHFFTVGPDEVRAWSIRQGTLAPGAAGTIHTDFEKGFICAKIYKFKDFRELKSEKAVKDKGLLRQEGRKYLMVDGDICHFEHNVTATKKKK